MHLFLFLALILSLFIPTPVVAEKSTPTATPIDPLPSTSTPLPTSTLLPTDTPAPTSTPLPTPTLLPTDTPASTSTPLPTPTLLPTDTPAPTSTPLPTPTPRPTPTPLESSRGGGTDRFEPNFDFEHAAVIEIGARYDLNFTPCPGESEDNDFFKLWVKPGMIVTCETFDLGPGVDTNVIIYDENGVGLAGHDDVDVTRGDLSSQVTVRATYTGWLYILVGQGRPAEGDDPSYGLWCYGGAPTPTPRPTPQIVPLDLVLPTLIALTPFHTPTPWPTFTPLPTPTPFPPTGTPTATFSPTPTPPPTEMPTSAPVTPDVATVTTTGADGTTGGRGWSKLTSALALIVGGSVLTALWQTGLLSLGATALLKQLMKLGPGLSVVWERVIALLERG